MPSRICSLAAVLLLFFGALGSAQAMQIVVTSTPNTDGSNPETIVITDRTGEVGVGPDGFDTWTGDFNAATFDISWNLSFDSDPGVGGTVLITNNTAVTQFYAYETGVVSSVEVPAGGLMSGSSTISIGDSDTSGTTAVMQALTNDAIYSGRISGVTERTLFNAPYTLTAGPNAVNTDIAGFSNETTTTPLPVGGLLSLRHAFRLSSGDTATANSTFVVVVPEPATLGQLGLGMAALGFLVRRRTLR